MAQLSTNTAVATGPPSRSEMLRSLHPRLLLAASRLLGRFGVPGEADDVVQGAILALLDGKCPPHVALDRFLYKKMKNIIFNAIRHHSRVPTTFVEDPGLLDKYLVDPACQEASVDQRRVLDEVFSALLAAADAKPDAEVSLMLAEYRDGNYDRGAVADALDLTPRQHDAVRRRLETLCRNLPSQLREAVGDLLGISL